MVTSIYAKVVALPTGYPEAMVVEYQVVDKQGEFIGPCYTSVPETWEQVKARFGIDAVYARECEGYFAEGSAALILNPVYIQGEWAAIHAAHAAQ